MQVGLAQVWSPVKKLIGQGNADYTVSGPSFTAAARVTLYILYFYIFRNKFSLNALESTYMVFSNKLFPNSYFSLYTCGYCFLPQSWSMKLEQSSP